MTSSSSIQSSSLSPLASITTTSSSTSSSTSIQSGTPSGGNSTNNDSGSDSGGDNIANSASLYLYTFLATLVLLLGVSAAIVVRSLLLRRRHRRMIEEAIRNGTYVPPSVLATARGRVDLANKPKMWEATVRSEWNGKEGSWADIFPVSASISSATILPLISSNPAEVISESNGINSSGNTTPAAGASTVSSRLRSTAAAPARIAVGMWRLISPGSHHISDTDTDSPTSNNNSSSVETKPHQSLPHAEMTTPTHMEVAVLIAMPGVLAAEANRSKEGADEEDLPHVEVGMAEVVIPPGNASANSFQEGHSSVERP